jgi:hypothetical protein
MPRPRTGSMEDRGIVSDDRHRWMLRASVTVRSENGLRVEYKRPSRQFIGTRAEAEQELSRWNGRVEREQEKARVDRIASVRNMTVNDLVERYLDNIDVDVTIHHPPPERSGLVVV